ncbi:hypothetical protein Ciccas_005586 [Cichlidogyrus casuarinus]|uniref:Ionotropic glutamate receptor C-terminal domain-containing protein n=1 Tax=Cichlidogyrus casuarinus TaxID=1844966 RepID=A0ABD2Q8P4_9PLAT
MNFGLSVMVRKPEKTKPGTFSFLNPLTYGVWLGILSAGIIIAVIMRVLSQLSPKELKRDDKTAGFTLGNSLWFIMASFMHQGIDLFPVSPSTRLLAAIWRFFCLVLTAYYTANLAAALSVGKLISPINSLQDLIDKKDLGYQVGMVGNGSTHAFFASSNDSLYKEVYKMMLSQSKEMSFPTEIGLGVENVRNRQFKYAFILETRMNEYLNQRKPCNTMQVGEPFTSKTYAVAVAPAFEFLKKNITQMILLMREDQTLAKLYSEWWIEKGECPDGTKDSPSEALTLVNLSGAFYILIAGLMLAMIMGLYPIVTQYKNSKRDSIDLPSPKQTNPGRYFYAIDSEI